MMQNVRWLWLPFVALLAYAASIWWPQADQEKERGKERPPQSVTVATVAEHDMALGLTALGTVAAREGVVITAQQTGVIAALHFRDGDKVAANALLVSLQDNEEKAKLLEAQARLADARQQWQRLQNLSAEKAVSRSSIEDKAAALKIAEAQVTVAQAVLAKREIRAPFAGVLGLREVSPGALISPGTRITTLDDLRRVRVLFSLPETELAQVRTGMTVQGESSAYPAQAFNGVLKHIDARVNAATRSLQALAELDNPALLLKPGMLLMLRVGANATATVKDNAKALAVPEGAIVTLGAEKFVWRVELEPEANTQKVRQILVQTGRRRVGFVEIISGVTVGEKVVVEGTHKLREGQKVLVQ